MKVIVGSGIGIAAIVCALVLAAKLDGRSVSTHELAPGSASVQLGEARNVPLTQETDCTFVELYPGYPGYRGFVAGLSGPGEVACLEELQRDFPWFDRALEDSENAAAAARLGLAGGPADWVWENWLAIEAERGIPVTCYLCAFNQIANGAPYEGAFPDPNDIRLQVGNIGSTELLQRVAARNGIELGNLQYFAMNDYELRAAAWAANAGRQINAWELQSTYDALAAAIVGPIGQANVFYQVFEIAIAQGGYAPTPPNAALDDQIFLMAVAEETDGRGMNPLLRDAQKMRFDRIVNMWASERGQGSTQGLGAFIAGNMGY